MLSLHETQILKLTTIMSLLYSTKYDIKKIQGKGLVSNTKTGIRKCLHFVVYAKSKTYIFEVSINKHRTNQQILGKDGCLWMVVLPKWAVI